MVGRRTRVAVFGGNGRFDKRQLPNCRVKVYQSRRFGGNGPLQCLLDSLKAGGVDVVIILARWNGHPGTNRIRELCKQRCIPVEVRT